MSAEERQKYANHLFNRFYRKLLSMAGLRNIFADSDISDAFFADVDASVGRYMRSESAFIAGEISRDDLKARILEMHQEWEKLLQKYETRAHADPPIEAPAPEAVEPEEDQNLALSL